MNSIAVSKPGTSSFLVILAMFMSLCFFDLHAADAPATYSFVNEKSCFKATPQKDVPRLMREKLGRPPEFCAKDLAAIKKGEIVVHKLGEVTTDGQLFEAFGTVDASPKELMAFMRDFPSRVGIMPHLEKVNAEWEDNLAVVDITIKVVFSSLSYRLNVLHYGDHFIEWEYVHGDIKNTQGCYKFFPFSNGTRTLIVYQETSDPGVHLPQFILDLLTKNSIPDVIRAMRKGMAMR